MTNSLTVYSHSSNNQLSREGDFSRMDDYVDDTINYAAEKMANWILQFIKLFYTEDHLKRLLGEDGKMVFMKLNRDLIEDGMEVNISASGSDKLKAEQRAMDMAKMKLIDPYRFYKDIGASDPKGRTVDLMTFLMQPNMYLQNISTGQPNGAPGQGQALAGSLQGAQEGQMADPNVPQPPQAGEQLPPDPSQQPQGAPPPPDQPQPSAQAAQDIMLIQQGQIPPVPQQVDGDYLATLTAFMQSPELLQIIQEHPEIKGPLMQWFQQVEALAQGQGQQNIGQPQPQIPGQPTGAEQFGQEGGNTKVGPLTSNPTPGNTAQIDVGAH